jgi:hypothetical protein
MGRTLRSDAFDLAFDFDSACHPEEAESHAKRATPDEGPVQLGLVWVGHSCPTPLILLLPLILTGKGTASAVPINHPFNQPVFSRWWTADKK